LTQKKNSLDRLRQISPHLHLRKHPRQYDCYMVIQLQKNYCTSSFLQKGRKQTWMKTMQNHGRQYPISPMQITKQRKPSFSYLLTVSNRCYDIRHLIGFLLHLRSTCRIPSDEACLGSGLSRYLAQRLFSLHISEVRPFLSSQENY
jgi:hypothetical protein